MRAWPIALTLVAALIVSFFVFTPAKKSGPVPRVKAELEEAPIVAREDNIVIAQAPEPVKEQIRDVQVFASESMAIGSMSAVRVFVTEEGRYLSGQEIRIGVRANQVLRPLGSGITDPRGTFCAEFEVPNQPGEHVLVVNAFGAEFVRPVSIRRPLAVSLDTDRASYRPCEKIGVRAVVRDLSTGRPIGGSPVVFEIVDPKENRIFRRTETTSEFGVAQAGLPLADELIPGEYQIRASAGGLLSKKTVTVSNVAPPLIEATLETTQRFPWMGQALEGVVTARYRFGAPARGTFTGSAKVLVDQEYDLGMIYGSLNEDGIGTFQVQLPEQILSNQKEPKNPKEVRLQVTVMDPVQRTATVSKVLSFEMNPVRVQAHPELGRVMAGQDNKIWLFTTWSDGSPVSAQVSIDIAGKTTHVLTDRNGVGSFDLAVGDKKIEAALRVKDATGHFGFMDVSFEPSKGFRMDLASPTLRVGEKAVVNVRAPGAGLAYVEWGLHGQVRASLPCPLTNGRGSIALNLPAGIVELHAYAVDEQGKLQCDSRLAHVEGAPGLRVSLKGSDLHVVDAYGRGVPAAVLIDMFQPDAKAKQVPIEAIRTRLVDLSARPLSTLCGQARGKQASFARPTGCSCRDGRHVAKDLFEPRGEIEGWAVVHTDRQGRAKVDLKAPYGVGEWSWSAFAIAEDGSTGRSTGTVRGQADFVADVALPPTLTRGDVVQVPITVYNPRTSAQKIKVQVQPEPWFELKEPAREFELAPRSVQTAGFTLRVKRPGSHSLTAKIQGEVHVRRTEVAPDGKVMEETTSFVLDRNRTERFSIPKSAIEGSERVLVRLTPSPIAQMQESLKGMLKEPHG